MTIRSLDDLERANLQCACASAHRLSAADFEQLCSAVLGYWRKQWRREDAAREDDLETTGRLA